VVQSSRVAPLVYTSRDEHRNTMQTTTRCIFGKIGTALYRSPLTATDENRRRSKIEFVGSEATMCERRSAGLGMTNSVSVAAVVVAAAAAAGCAFARWRRTRTTTQFALQKYLVLHSFKLSYVPVAVENVWPHCSLFHMLCNELVCVRSHKHDSVVLAS